ncbi:hypothetical protein ACIBG4_17635 [Nonomuraea sp. NPDC050383]|uniref:hypothetical protein n=1 Tax=Nonomuraea sp. NPDC050383 TaxID=3364362 RepID=UPI0037A02A60
MDQGSRGDLMGRLAEATESVTTTHPLRVAIDGPPAAGKTTLADELAAVLRAQGHDIDTDTPLSPPVTTAPADAVLLFDGVFLLRPELIDRWDLRIFVSVPFGRTVGRAQIRGTALAGSAAGTTDIERCWRNRYIPSQQLYFATARPTDHADIIVYNDELLRPSWEVRSN